MVSADCSWFSQWSKLNLHLPSVKSASIAISGGSEANNTGDVGKYGYHAWHIIIARKYNRYYLRFRSEAKRKRDSIGKGEYVFILSQGKNSKKVTVSNEFNGLSIPCMFHSRVQKIENESNLLFAVDTSTQEQSWSIFESGTKTRTRAI